MKVEIKHLAAYLPYGVKCTIPGHIWESEHFTITGLDDTQKAVKVTATKGGGTLRDGVPLTSVILLLRPLTGNELTTPIYLNGRMFEPLSELEEMAETDVERQFIEKLMEDPSKVIYAPYTIVQQLLEWYFDIYGLLPAGLAIPLTTP